MSVAPHPGDRIVVSLLQPLAEGERFRKWPLHVTLLPWFRTSLSTREIEVIMATTLRQVDPFTATMGETAHFGYHDQVPVRLVSTPNGFAKIHNHLWSTLSQDDRFHFIYTEHVGPNFRAHVTLHGYEPLRQDDIVACNDLQIVQLGHIHPGGSEKRVEGEIDLG